MGQVIPLSPLLRTFLVASAGDRDRDDRKFKDRDDLKRGGDRDRDDIKLKGDRDHDDLKAKRDRD